MESRPNVTCDPCVQHIEMGPQMPLIAVFSPPAPAFLPLGVTWEQQWMAP